VIATVAVLIALSGGVAYTANQLAKNSVGPKQLKKSRPQSGRILVFYNQPEEDVLLVFGSGVDTGGTDMGGVVASTNGKTGLLNGVTFLAQS
jgi:hypothetical protein